MCTGSICLNFTMQDFVFSPVSEITQSVSSPVPEPVTCAHHLRMWQERDNKPLSVSRGGARTEEPVCYLTGKSVTLCEDVQAARSRTASFEEKDSRKGNSPPLGSCPRKKGRRKKKEKKAGCCLTDTNTALCL